MIREDAYMKLSSSMINNLYAGLIYQFLFENLICPYPSPLQYHQSISSGAMSIR